MTLQDISLRLPTLRFFHALISGKVTKRGDTTEAIGHCEFDYLLSISDNIPYHMGYVIVTTYFQQATDPKVGTLFLGPYITWLIRGMSLLGNVDQMLRVGWFNFIT